MTSERCLETLETNNEQLSPRDRDIDALPPLADGLVFDLAGQASAVRNERNDALFNTTAA